MAVSVACAIHCAATPVLLSFAPLLGISAVGGTAWFSSPVVHQIAAVVCCLLMARALAPRVRGELDGLTATMAGIGISLLLIAAFVLPDPCCPPNAVLAGLGAPLFSLGDLREIFGGWTAYQLAACQPYLTPLGGIALVSAHAMNLNAARRQRRPQAELCCLNA